MTMAAIDRARVNAEGLAISDITLVELATLAKKKRITLGYSVEAFLKEVEQRFVVVAISAIACARAMALPKGFPNDPADRIIAATALVNGLVL